MQEKEAKRDKLAKENKQYMIEEIKAKKEKAEEKR